MRENSILKERILQYLENKGISKYEFYQKTGVSNGILSQKNGINEENILRFLNYFDDISPDWLLTGKGEMLRCGKAPTTPLPDDNPLSHSSEKDLNALVTVIDRQSQQIERLIAIIETITNKK